MSGEKEVECKREKERGRVLQRKQSSKKYGVRMSQRGVFSVKGETCEVPVRLYDYREHLCMSGAGEAPWE